MTTATSSDKKSENFGLWFCNTIINKEWFSGKDNVYGTRADEFSMLRSHMTGKVNDIANRQLLSSDGVDASNTSIDTSFRHIMPKYIKSVVDGMSDDVYEVTVDAVDEISQKERKDKAARERVKMMANDMLKKHEQALGYKLSFDDAAQSEEELLIRNEIDCKLEREIAIEVSVKKIFEANDISEISSRIKEDLCLFGVAATRNVMDSSRGVRVDYVTPENFIYSRGSRGSRTSDGRYYFGELIRMPISEVKRLSGDKFSEKEYKSMTGKSSYRTVYDRNSSYMIDLNDEEETVDVLNFCFKSDKKEVYKKREMPNSKHKLVKKDESWTPEYKTKNKVVDVYETWYGGWWVMGTDFMWGYGELKDLIRPSSDLKKAISPYSMYELQTQSIGKRILPHARTLQQINIKTKQLIARAIPKGHAVDYKALMEVDLGNGQMLSPEDQVKMFFEDGNIIYSSEALDGGLNGVGRPPIMPTQGGTTLVELNNAYMFELAQIEDITGINKMRDGSTPGSEMAVGVQKLSILMSNNATKHILNGLLHILKDTSIGVTCRLQDLGQYNELGDGVASLIGYDNARILSKSKDKFMWMFSTTVKLKPTEEEKEELKTMIRNALAAKTITISDAIDIEAIDNVKLASRMLKAKEKEKQRREERLAMEQIRRKGEQDRETAQLKARQDAIKNNTEMQAKASEINLKTNADAITMANEWKFKMKYLEQEFKYNYMLKQLEVSGITDRDMEKEKGKSDRQREQATMASKLTEQKQNNMSSLDFTNQQNQIE